MFENSHITKLEKLVDRMNILCIALDRWVASELPPHQAIANVATEIWRDLKLLEESISSVEDKSHRNYYPNRIEPLTEQ